MSKLIATLLAGAFAAVTISPVALAQDQKKEQVHKGTPEQGTVQKKDQKKAKKKDGSGKKAPEKQ
jgi:pentapeptide MXKDX repeat protein